ncbi:hypothetical protein AMTRI_Chr13g88610 [Amborella trichopoda]
MDHKTWLWRKKPSQKTIVVGEKLNLSSNESEEQNNEIDKVVDLERSLKDLNERLSSSLNESRAKDDIVKQHSKVAEEAIAGWEKAEAEAASFKQELDGVVRQKVAAEERIVQLDAALKECTRQLRHVREEQEERIHDAIMKTTRDMDKVRIEIEEKLSETSKRLIQVTADNNQLHKALQVQEKLIEEISERKSQAEADFNALLSRLDSAEKDNSALKYEVCMLEKELEIRNEEREYNLKSSEASRKQHLESMKKIAKLEMECQRLRLLVRKRLPGPAALAQMKNEVENLGRDAFDQRKKKWNASHGSALIVRDYSLSDDAQEAANKRISILTERLWEMEEETKILKETLTKKNSELQSSRTMCARTVSKLSQVEAQLGVFLKGENCLELMRSPISHDISLSSISEDGGKEDEASCAESWASALISELEHFKKESPNVPPSCRSLGATELSLMDDFVEMERLAVVSAGNPQECMHPNSTTHGNGGENGHFKTEQSEPSSEVTGKELVPYSDGHKGVDNESQNLILKYPSKEKFSSWLHDLLKNILQDRVSQKCLDDILEEVRIAVTVYLYSLSEEAIDLNKCSSNSETLDSPIVNSHISWKSPLAPPCMNLLDGVCGTHLFFKEGNKHSISPRLNKAISKIIELINGLSPTILSDYNDNQFAFNKGDQSLPYKSPNANTGYTMRVFQWQSTEVKAVIQKFSQVCNDLLQGNADLDRFAVELSATFDWIVSHCFSLQDVSNMKDAIKKNLHWDEQSCSDGELEDEAHHTPRSKDSKHMIQKSPSDSSASQDKEDVEHKLREENERLNLEILNVTSEKKYLEHSLQVATETNESLKVQLQDLEQNIANIQEELAAMKESKGLIEDQMENHKLLNEDLDTQLSVAKVELNEAHQKFTSLQVELEDKKNCSEELEATCLELQLQLESVANKKLSKPDMDGEEMQMRTNWEISAASEKLAECQETILNLGKQLKALAAPHDAALFEKVVISSTNRRPSLLDRLIEDDENTKATENQRSSSSPKTKEIICSADAPPAGLFFGRNVSSNLKKAAEKPVGNSFHASPVKSPSQFYGLKTMDTITSGGSLSIVPKRQSGGVSLLKKLLLRKKRGSNKKT